MIESIKKLFKRKPVFVGFVCFHGELFIETQCPNCDYGIYNEYVSCPYCGQRIKPLREDDIQELILKHNIKQIGKQ